jgi:hypothetical protein
VRRFARSCIGGATHLAGFNSGHRRIVVGDGQVVSYILLSESDLVHICDLNIFIVYLPVLRGPLVIRRSLGSNCIMKRIWRIVEKNGLSELDGVWKSRNCYISLGIRTVCEMLWNNGSNISIRAGDDTRRRGGDLSRGCKLWRESVCWNFVQEEIEEHYGQPPEFSWGLGGSVEPLRRLLPVLLGASARFPCFVDRPFYGMHVNHGNSHLSQG